MTNIFDKMKRRKFKSFTLLVLLAGMSLGLLASCAPDIPPEDIPSLSSSKGPLSEEPSLSAEPVSYGAIGERPMFIAAYDTYGADSVEPSVEPYTINQDLSNIDNLWQFYINEDMGAKLSENAFAVRNGSGNSEFFQVYETNRYAQIPSFITVDSMMHTYHLYFSHLMKNIEKNYLYDSLKRLSAIMLDASMVQYERLKGSEWENAARRNIAFFTVGSVLLGDDVDVHDDVKDIVDTELAAINSASGIGTSGITDIYEDYTQYRPRGYYEGDEQLERYFKAMMWYGRMHFSHEYEDMDRSALLMTMAVSGAPEAYSLWESIYAVTAFFAGASDDLGICDYWPVICEVYGEDLSLSSLTDNPDTFSIFYEKTSALPVPMINSIPIEDGEDNTISGFRFMGQRFTIDASIMQSLIYQNTGANSRGDNRMLPDVLDVPAALGNDTALNILDQNGATDYEGYSETIAALRKTMPSDDSPVWTASLYANWLNTLRPILQPKGEGYPIFMQNGEWAKKNLECFAGSYTELKHDTILYSKQVMAEMGGDGGESRVPDDRGYVEPEPLVYSRFASLAILTSQGLSEYHMLNADDEENLSRLAQIAQQLITISEKELRDETLSDEEYEFIRNYGGNLEHFWYDSMKSGDLSEHISVDEYPAALVVDIATDPNGFVLEAANGNPSTIYVVIKVDGKLKIAAGSVYSFYQFEWPMNDRLTDSKWRYMMGLEAGDDGYYSFDSKIDKPEWTMSYRY